MPYWLARALRSSPGWATTVVPAMSGGAEPGSAAPPLKGGDQVRPVVEDEPERQASPATRRGSGETSTSARVGSAALRWKPSGKASGFESSRVAPGAV